MELRRTECWKARGANYAHSSWTPENNGCTADRKDCWTNNTSHWEETVAKHHPLSSQKRPERHESLSTASKFQPVKMYIQTQLIGRLHPQSWSASHINTPTVIGCIQVRLWEIGDWTEKPTPLWEVNHCSKTGCYNHTKFKKCRYSNERINANVKFFFGYGWTAKHWSLHWLTFFHVSQKLTDVPFMNLRPNFFKLCMTVTSIRYQNSPFKLYSNLVALKEVKVTKSDIYLSYERDLSFIQSWKN